MKIAILGAGKMGAWFAKFFRDEGYSVIVADRKKEKMAKLEKQLGVETAGFLKAVSEADRILICVSISAFESIVKMIAPSIRKNQVVMDICSIKERPVKIMHKYIKRGVVLGTHPVFGPGSKGIRHKAFVLTPTRPEEEEFAGTYKTWLEEKEARVFVVSPRKHDELMSVVLGLPHFLGVVACDTLLEQDSYSETKKVAGTTYRMLFTLAEATTLENPQLYASLQLNLPELDKLENRFLEKACEWLKLIQQKDREAIAQRIEHLKTKLMTSCSEHTRSYEVMYKMLEATES